MQNAACKKKVLLSYIEKTSHLINVFDFGLPGDGSYGKLKDLRWRLWQCADFSFRYLWNISNQPLEIPFV